MFMSLAQTAFTEGLQQLPYEPEYKATPYFSSKKTEQVIRFWVLQARKNKNYTIEKLSFKVLNFKFIISQYYYYY
jgi:hypothetical protein